MKIRDCWKQKPQGTEISRSTSETGAAVVTNKSKSKNQWQGIETGTCKDKNDANKEEEKNASCRIRINDMVNKLEVQPNNGYRQDLSEKVWKSLSDDFNTRMDSIENDKTNGNGETEGCAMNNSEQEDTWPEISAVKYEVSHTRSVANRQESQNQSQHNHRQ